MGEANLGLARSRPSLIARNRRRPASTTTTSTSSTSTSTSTSGPGGDGDDDDAPWRKPPNENWTPYNKRIEEEKAQFYENNKARVCADLPAFQERYRHKLIHAYSQAKELKSIPRLFRPESTGMCQALCFTWIRKRHADTEPVSTRWWKTREYNSNQDAYKKVHDKLRINVGPPEALEAMQQRDKKLRPLRLGRQQGYMPSPDFPTPKRWDAGC